MKSIFHRITFAFFFIAIFSMVNLSIAFAGDKVTVYMVRHAEKQTELVDNGNGSFDKVYVYDSNGKYRPSEVLNPLGEMRAQLLADHFAKKNITHKLTHVFSSHKQRTRQTVELIAADADLLNDDDQTLDGVQQLPAFVKELDYGYESSSTSKQPMIDALSFLPDGSVVLVAAHSGTIYGIMEYFGIDTSDEQTYPRIVKDGKVKVQGYGNIWKFTIRDGLYGELKKHEVYEFDLHKQ